MCEVWRQTTACLVVHSLTRGLGGLFVLAVADLVNEVLVVTPVKWHSTVDERIQQHPKSPTVHLAQRKGKQKKTLSKDEVSKSSIRGALGRVLFSHSYNSAQVGLVFGGEATFRLVVKGGHINPNIDNSAICINHYQ